MLRGRKSFTLASGLAHIGLASGLGHITFLAPCREHFRRRASYRPTFGNPQGLGFDMDNAPAIETADLEELGGSALRTPTDIQEAQEEVVGRQSQPLVSAAA